MVIENHSRVGQLMSDFWTERDVRWCGFKLLTRPTIFWGDGKNREGKPRTVKTFVNCRDFIVVVFICEDDLLHVT